MFWFSTQDLVRLLQMFLGGLLLSFVVHELGHAVACLLMGNRIVAFGLGPFGFHRERGSWQGPVWSLRGFVAHCPISARYLRTKAFVITLAGPASSFSFAAICSWTAAHLRGVLGEDGASFFEITATYSLMAGVFSLIPLRVRDLQCDGALLLGYLSRGSHAHRCLAIAFLNACSKNGLRPREWDTQLASMALDGSERSTNDSFTNFMRYNWCADTGRTGSAQAALDRVLKECVYPAESANWTLEAAWLHATNNDLARAKAWIETAYASGDVPQDENAACANKNVECQKWKARAAIAILEGRLSHACDAATKALAALQVSDGFDAGLRKGTREDVEALQHEALLRLRAVDVGPAAVES